MSLESLPSEPSRVRLSANLARHVGKVGIGDGSGSEQAGRFRLETALPGLTGTAERSAPLCDGRATLIVGADVETGPWHYSSGGTIERFDAAKASKSGKFGPGTYFGVGELAGETVDGLRLGATSRYDVGFSGNILVASRDQVDAIATSLRTSKGLPISRVRSSTRTASLTEYAHGQLFDGEAVDAVMVYMDADRRTAEIAVLPEATDHLRIVHGE